MIPNSSIGIGPIDARQVREATGIGLYGPLFRIFFLGIISAGSLITWLEPAQGMQFGPVLTGFGIAAFGGIYYLACFLVRLKGGNRIGTRADNWLEYIQAVVDSALTLSTIYISGTQTSSWVILLLTITTYYMTTAGPRFGTLLTGFLVVAYSTLVILESRQLIPYAPIHATPIFESYVSVAVVNFGAIGSVTGALLVGNFVGRVTFASVQRLVAREQQLTRKYDELIHGISDIIWECDRNRIFTFVSGGIRQALGHEPSDLVGREFRTLCTSDDLPRVDEWLAGDGPRSGGILDFGAVAKDLTLHWISTTVAPITGPHGEFAGFRGTARDVTNARIAEERLSRSSRYEAVASLASGIAHDFNNLFNAINGFAQLERLSVTAETESAENLDAIIKATRRGTALTANLLNLSRPQLLRKHPVNLSDLLTNTRQIARASVGPLIHIDIETHESCHVLGDETLLSSVFLNLCLNARDAIGKAPGRIRMSISNAGGQIQIRVEDSGTGIQPELKEKIFLPFYTTKPRGSGTGLGLAMARKIITEHGGTLEAGSSPLGGACFTISLPETPASPEADFQAGGDTGTLPANACRIVVVDDEESNLELLSKVLERRGHSVIPFTSGAEALRWFGQNGSQVNLVVLDMLMPEISGLDTFRELRSTHPKLPVIFISGYAESDHIQSALREPGTAFVPKPLELEKFVDLVEKSAAA